MSVRMYVCMYVSASRGSYGVQVGALLVDMGTSGTYGDGPNIFLCPAVITGTGPGNLPFVDCVLWGPCF